MYWPHLYFLKLKNIREQIEDLRRSVEPYVWNDLTSAADDQLTAICYDLEDIISQAEEGYDPQANNACPSRHPDKIRIRTEGDE